VNSKKKEKTDNEIQKLSVFEKLFTLIVISGAIYLIVNGFNEYREILNNPNVTKGIVYNVKLNTATSESNYSWDIFYKYNFNDKHYKSVLNDKSAFSKDYSKGDSLYVYFSKVEPEKSFAFKHPIKMTIKPNIINFMLRDSRNGYLLLLVLLGVAVYTIPVLLDLIYILFVGLVLKIINEKKSITFFEKGFLRLKNKTIIKIDNYLNSW
jgi:hypothetical protein